MNMGPSEAETGKGPIADILHSGAIYVGPWQCEFTDQLIVLGSRGLLLN
jgi:hypothetical protein